MEGYLRLSARERKICLTTYRAARPARRALVLLLLAEGRSYRDIDAAMFATPLFGWLCDRTDRYDAHYEIFSV